MKALICVAFALALTACGGADSGSGSKAPCSGSEYCAADHWLCRPDIANDYCAETQTATVIAANGTQSTETLPKSTAPKVDCFYVYPTVALTQPVGNMKDFSNIADILVPLRAQGVPFSAVCRMFAPLYHQITLATYTSPEVNQDLENAYADVEKAFDTYLTQWNAGRDFILMGHSQGAHMTRRLLQRKIEGDPALEAKLVLGMPIGPVGDITVPVGAVVGGTFTSLPLCTSKAERGCIVAYDSAAAVVAGSGTVPAGANDAACVNPAAVGSTALVPFRETLIPTKNYAGQFGMGTAPDYPTTFVSLKNMYSGACARSALGGLGLQVSYTPPPGTTMASPVNLQTQLMHILDYSFPMGDLLDLAQAKIDSKP